MKKEADRIRRWRERQKAEGKTSFTVLLSQEAREFLAEEKEKTGESYALIVEKALHTLKKQGYRPPVLKHFPKRDDVTARAAAREHHPPATAVTSHDNGAQPRILIDDLATTRAWRISSASRRGRNRTAYTTSRPTKGSSPGCCDHRQDPSAGRKSGSNRTRFRAIVAATRVRPYSRGDGHGPGQRPAPRRTPRRRWRPR